MCSGPGPLHSQHLKKLAKVCVCVTLSCLLSRKPTSKQGVVACAASCPVKAQAVVHGKTPRGPRQTRRAASPHPLAAPEWRARRTWRRTPALRVLDSGRHSAAGPALACRRPSGPGRLWPGAFVRLPCSCPLLFSL